MDNLGRAIYMAGFALLFVFAASTAIYLYSFLLSYMKDVTTNTNIQYHAESTVTGESSGVTKRQVTGDEIYLVAYQMEQMHVDKLVLQYDSNEVSITKDVSIKRNEDEENQESFKRFIQAVNSALSSNSNRTFTYTIISSVKDGCTVTYSAN